MSDAETLTRAPEAVHDDHTSADHHLFQVWFDADCGHEVEPDWWPNTPPQQLSSALDEAAALRREIPPWICIVVAEGVSPRADGRFEPYFGL